MAPHDAEPVTEEKVKESLTALGLDLSRADHRKLVEAALGMVDERKRLSDEDLERIVEDVTENLSKQLPEPRTEIEAERRQSWLAQRRKWLIGALGGIGGGVASTGAWELLVYLWEHVPIFAPAEEDQGLAERERQRASRRHALVEPLSSSLRADLEAQAWNYKFVLGEGLHEVVTDRLRADGRSAQFFLDLTAYRRQVGSLLVGHTQEEEARWHLDQAARELITALMSAAEERLDAIS